MSSVPSRALESPDPRSDAELVSECLAGDADSFGELTNRYSRAVYLAALRVCRNRQDAEDLTQEVFLKAFRSLAAYDLRRPFWPWIHRITRNASIDLTRARRFEVPLELPVGEGGSERMFAVEPSVDEALAARQDGDRARAIIAELPRREREVLELHYLAEVSSETLTKRLRLSLSGVKSRLHRARNNFRKRLLVSPDAPALSFERAAVPRHRSARASRRRSAVAFESVWSAR